MWRGSTKSSELPCKSHLWRKSQVKLSLITKEADFLYMSWWPGSAIGQLLWAVLKTQMLFCLIMRLLTGFPFLIFVFTWGHTFVIACALPLNFHSNLVEKLKDPIAEPLQNQGTQPSMQLTWTTVIMKTHSRFGWNLVQASTSSMLNSGATSSLLFAFLQPRLCAEQVWGACKGKAAETWISTLQGRNLCQEGSVFFSVLPGKMPFLLCGSEVYPHKIVLNLGFVCW